MPGCRCKGCVHENFHLLETGRRVKTRTLTGPEEVRSCSLASSCVEDESTKYGHVSHNPPGWCWAHSDLPINQYHQYSDATMETLLDSLENLLDEEGNPEYEVEYSSGVLTLKLGEHGTYVINKQPPNKQIWLSSPVSGPKRYDYVVKEDEWIYSRDQKSLGSLLNEELSKVFDQNIDLGVDRSIYRDHMTEILHNLRASFRLPEASAVRMYNAIKCDEKSDAGSMDGCAEVVKRRRREYRKMRWKA
ncbi:hypothetical protein BDY19DRAFT_908857 [Irpex rosettiformis]|uniref:Uncharacterized protein n=1 Tax=Irpex rosettiformis TaxID=378272 RepID=A0ACB8TUG9_9APHY|nr:hypothetical protein BDY19DRAFT_908857 [Irpex rosettiformis]